MLLKGVIARRIKDSRGEDTIEVEIEGQKASSPAGKSTGKYETPSYHNSIDWNIHFLNSFSPDIEINSFNDLKKLENVIKKQCKFKDVKQFGANALFALECAILKALAKENKKQLWQIINPKAKKFPIPAGNAIGGGLHSHNPNHPEFQEFLLIPKAKSFKENVNIMNEVYSSIQKKLNSKSINDEGALETSNTNGEILEALLEHKNKINMGIDIAASSFYKNNKYIYKSQNLSKQDQIDYINFLIDSFNILYVEDPLNEEDFKGFSKISTNRSPRTLVVGDDLTTTHIDRLKKAIKSKSINAIIVKPNQNGSLIEVKELVDLCKKNKIKTILSHRSGETHDSAIADLAFAFQTDYIKCGIATSFRKVKLQRLIDIEKSNNKV